MCEMTEKEQAELYVELARMNKESHHSRRQVEWKVNFGVWGAYALVTYVILSNVDKCRLGIIPAACLVLGYFFVARRYRRHTQRLLGSHRVDIEWWLYYKDRAEELLGADVSHQRGDGLRTESVDPDERRRKLLKLVPWEVGQEELRKHSLSDFVWLTYGLAAIASVVPLCLVRWGAICDFCNEWYQFLFLYTP